MPYPQRRRCHNRIVDISYGSLNGIPERKTGAKESGD